MLIRDFDNPASYAAWKARHRHLAEVLVAVQARRGPHVWFRCRDYLQSGERSLVRNLGDGELRGDSHVAMDGLPRGQSRLRLPASNALWRPWGCCQELGSLW